MWSLSQLSRTPRDREVATLEESRNNEGRRQDPAIYFSSKEKGQSNQKEIPGTQLYHESCRPSIWENRIPFELQPIVSNKQPLIGPTSCLTQPLPITTKTRQVPAILCVSEKELKIIVLIRRRV